MNETDIRVGFYSILAIAGGILVVRFFKEMKSALG
jgi:hypothetical protein